MRNIDLTDISFAKKKTFCVYQETHAFLHLFVLKERQQANSGRRKPWHYLSNHIFAY